MDQPGPLDDRVNRVGTGDPGAVAHFFRLLQVPVEQKGEALLELVRRENTEREDVQCKGTEGDEGPAVGGQAFALAPAEFGRIPGSPFAYWVGDAVRRIFVDLPAAEGAVVAFRSGLGTTYNFRFLRLSWEVLAESVGRVWHPHAKGGAYSPYYSDVHLLVDWENDGQHIKDLCRENGDSPSRYVRSEDMYLRPGLTWTNSTTLQMSTRALPAGCIFGHMGPSAFVEHDNGDDLLILLSIMNSSPFHLLISLQLGLATAGRRHYEVGLIQRTPIPPLTDRGLRLTLSSLARRAHDLQRERSRDDETAHVFDRPGLLRHPAGSLAEAAAARRAELDAAAGELAAIQAEIDRIVAGLYGLELPAEDTCACPEAVAQGNPLNPFPKSADSLPVDSTAAEDAAEEAPPPDGPRAWVADWLMWCLGVAFGRWDVRAALDPARLPPLPGPFDPLPRCAPGALAGPDGLPLPPGALPDGYPLPVPPDGMLVDDPTHPADVVTRLRQVLGLIYGGRADAVEAEACRLLGVASLRAWLRDARQGFFAWHVKRYSKSRRRAPIYWPLQSERRGYAIWLDCHRLTPVTLYAAGRDYADAKLALEGGRLEELQRGLAALSATARRGREREIERQAAMVAEVAAFRKRLDAAALLDLRLDLNDGVLIAMAPLRELVPWKEVPRMWEALLAGEYAWSGMARQMREKGMVGGKRR